MLVVVGELRSHFVEDPRACDYLPARQASLEYRVMSGVDVDELGALLERGWRRLGPFYFRPACAGCFECVSLRIPVAEFIPSASQKRAAVRARRFRIAVGPPRVDRARLELYARWHAGREVRRGWPASPLGASEYRLQFSSRWA
jgi:arginine-tRNA-protein transferase